MIWYWRRSLVVLDIGRLVLDLAVVGLQLVVVLVEEVAEGEAALLALVVVAAITTR